MNVGLALPQGVGGPTTHATVPTTFSLDEFVESFSALTGAEGGLTELREMVLCLAVKGDLVRQSPDDGDAETLLARLRSVSERSKSEPKREEKLRNDLLAPVEGPWSLPPSWRFVRLEQVSLAGGVFCDGDWVESKDQDSGGAIRLTQLADVGNGVWRDRSDRYMNRPTADRLRCTYLEEGDILIARMPDPIGRACIFPGDKRTCATVVDVAVLRVREEFFSRRFVMMAINSRPVREAINSQIAGTTRQRVSRSNLASVLVPVPPLAEQRRIVGKVDELMRLLDDLEAKQTKKRGAQTRLRTAALDALTSADRGEEFNAAWRRVVENFGILCPDASGVRDLRMSIRQLAVMGRLVPQDPEDAPVSPVLAQMRLQRDRWVATNAVRVYASKKMVHPFPIPWSLPPGWEKATWGSVSEWITYGFTRPMPHVDRGIPIVTGKNVTGGRIDLSTADLTTSEAFESLSDKDRPQAGDILITKDGSIGRAALVGRGEHFCINQSVAVVWLRTCEIDRRFLLLVIESPLTQGFIASRAEGAAIKHLSVVDFAQMPVLVPPLAEQRRIVAKVEHLLKLCDDLEAKLERAETTAAKLAEAVVAEMVGA